MTALKSHIVGSQRRVSIAVLVALCGAAIALGSMRSWVAAGGTRPASGIDHTAIRGVLHWHYQSTASFTNSFALVVLVAGALVFVGGVFASPLVASLFSFVALAATGVWIGLNATYFSPSELRYSDLRLGAWLAIGGGLLGLMSSFFLRRGEI